MMLEENHWRIDYMLRRVSEDNPILIEYEKEKREEKRHW